MYKNQAKSNYQINDRNYGEAFEAKSKCFAPVPNHPARRAGPHVFYMENREFVVGHTKTVHAKSNTVARNKKRASKLKEKRKLFKSITACKFICTFL